MLFDGDDDDALARQVRAKLHSEDEALTRLELTGRLRPIEATRTRLVRRTAAGSRRALNEVNRQVLREFVSFGAKAVLSTGAQRGGDFLNNQLRGRWAEEVVLSMKLPSLHFAALGPSGAAMPGHENHRQVVATYSEIQLVEGKRPDLIAFPKPAFKALTADERNAVVAWPDRLLNAGDLPLLQKARFGIEVKNSTWHFGRRRERHAVVDEDDDLGTGRLAITVKDEELEKIVEWIQRTGKPVLFFQVLFDEIYCMSFSRMVDALHAGRVYTEGDYLRDGKTGAGGKLYHRFFLSDTRHRCAKVRWPKDSIAHVEVLASGSVIPYVELRPAQAYDEQPDVIESELQIAETALKGGVPVISGLRV